MAAGYEALLCMLNRELLPSQHISGGQRRKTESTSQRLHQVKAALGKTYKKCGSKLRTAVTKYEEK
jgi:hypothetical protein